MQHSECCIVRIISQCSGLCNSHVLVALGDRHCKGLWPLLTELCWTKRVAENWLLKWKLNRNNLYRHTFPIWRIHVTSGTTQYLIYRSHYSSLLSKLPLKGTEPFLFSYEPSLRLFSWHCDCTLLERYHYSHVVWAIPQQFSTTWQKVHGHTSVLVFGGFYSSTSTRLIQRPS